VPVPRRDSLLVTARTRFSVDHEGTADADPFSCDRRLRYHPGPRWRQSGAPSGPTHYDGRAIDIFFRLVTEENHREGGYWPTGSSLLTERHDEEYPDGVVDLCECDQESGGAGRDSQSPGDISEDELHPVEVADRRRQRREQREQTAWSARG
jgi:hypothetical protein